MKISKISLQGFRGFPTADHVPLSEGVTIIYAPNGSGKTSISEAFEWALYGEVARKIRSKTPGEFGQEFLRSAHADPSIETWAEIELLKTDGTKLVVRRTMVKGAESLLTVDGKTISNISEIEIETGLAFRPCLGQSEIKAFIDTEPVERWKQISAILGLGGFEAVRERLMKLNTDTDKMPEVIQIREAARRAVAPLISTEQNPLNQDPEALHTTIIKDFDLDSKSTWAQIQEIAEKKIIALLGMDKRPTTLDQLLSGPEALTMDGLEAEIKTINDSLEKHRLWHTTHKKVRFIEMGLKMTKAPLCPYCSEATITEEKLKELQKLTTTSDPEPQEINSNFLQVIHGFNVINTSPINTSVIGSLIDALSENQELITQLQLLPERQRQLSEKLVTLNGLSSGYIKVTNSSDTTTPVETIKLLGDQILDIVNQLVTEYASLRSDAQKLKESIQAKFSGLSIEERATLEKYQAIKKLATNITYVRQAWAISQRQAILENFIRQFEQAERDTVQSHEKELADDVRSFYSELSNSKSLEFKGFRIKQGARRQAALEAKAYNVDINPTSMFSEAQGNCLGLSLYFSQRVKRNPGWSTIILDDPVQSMDDGHKENLISLLNTLQTQNQIIVLTHDKAFKQSLSNQFSNNPAYIAYEIIKTEKTPEPTVEVQLERFDQLLSYAEKCADGASVQRETGFNCLRKAIEVFVRMVMEKHKIQAIRGDDLRQRINKLAPTPLALADTGTLLRIKGNCDPNSHDSTAADTPGKIRGHIKDLNLIWTKYMT